MTPEERQLLEWTSKLLAELKAEETAMSSSMGKPKYSPETILRYRALKIAGEFDRIITARVPIEPDWDLITMDCGHTTRLLVMPINNDYVAGVAHNCPVCEKGWLAAAAGDG
jgi:hypothetical protein